MTEAPTSEGLRSGSPVVDIIPDVAWVIGSYPGRSLYGPVSPNPEIEQ